MKCSNCGAEIEDGNRFCYNCGAKMIEPENPVAETTAIPPVGVCPKCGQSINPQSRFCEHCGENLTQPQVNPYTEPQPMPFVPPVVPISPVIPDVPVVEEPVKPVPQQDIMVEEKKSSGKGVWITLAILFGIAAVVLLILLLTKKDNDYGYYDEAPYAVEEVVEPWAEDSVAAEVVEVVEVEAPAAECYFSENHSRVDVYGMWNNLKVNVDVAITTYSDGSVSASGYAYYGLDEKAVYRLSGTGQNDGDAISLTLNEYNTGDGSYTGKWVGRAFLSSSRGLNYYGNFYNIDDTEECYFDLYEVVATY